MDARGQVSSRAQLSKLQPSPSSIRPETARLRFDCCAHLLFQFVVILESVLAKLSRYDEGTLFSSFLSFTVSNNLLNLRVRVSSIAHVSLL